MVLAVIFFLIRLPHVGEGKIEAAFIEKFFGKFFNQSSAGVRKYKTYELIFINIS